AATRAKSLDPRLTYPLSCNYAYANGAIWHVTIVGQGVFSWQKVNYAVIKRQKSLNRRPSPQHRLHLLDLPHRKALTPRKNNGVLHFRIGIMQGRSGAHTYIRMRRLALPWQRKPPRPSWQE